nr:hypothetical protein Iba_chr11cCG11490 [Ipomoea batatas]
MSYIVMKGNTINSFADSLFLGSFCTHEEINEQNCGEN